MRKRDAAVSPTASPLLVRSLKVVLVLELFDTSATVCKLLLTGEERMTLRANVHSHLGVVGQCHKCITTCASNFTFLIIRMDSFLHVRLCLSCRAYNLPTYFLFGRKNFYSPYMIAQAHTESKRNLQKNTKRITKKI